MAFCTHRTGLGRSAEADIGLGHPTSIAGSRALAAAVTEYLRERGSVAGKRAGVLYVSLPCNLHTHSPYADTEPGCGRVFRVRARLSNGAGAIAFQPADV